MIVDILRVILLRSVFGVYCDTEPLKHAALFFKINRARERERKRLPEDVLRGKKRKHVFDDLTLTRLGFMDRYLYAFLLLWSNINRTKAFEF